MRPVHMYQPLTTPQGVPSPYHGAVHPYPSYEHGPDYTRPVFDMPFMQAPYNVLNGLGQLQILPSGGWVFTSSTNAETHRENQRMAVYKGAGAAAVVGLLIAAVTAPRVNRGRAMAQGAVAFAVVGLVASGVTYSTWPKVVE